jgi:3-oxoadipate enol-lactonase
MPFVDNKGVRLHWDEQGQGSPILLIMGHRYSSALWYSILPALAAQHRVIWFDNRGAGQSGATKRVSVQELAGDALAVMDAAGVERAHIFGVSMGGVIAQELALLQPQRVRSLMLGCTGLLSAEKPRAPEIVTLLYHLPPQVMSMVLRRNGANHGYGAAASPEAVAYDQAMVAKDIHDRSGLAAQARAMLHYRTTKQAVAGLTMPALVLHGDEDSVVPFSYGEELAATLPNSQFVRLEGAGHNFLVARGEQSAAAVLDFVRGVDAGA